MITRERLGGRALAPRHDAAELLPKVSLCPLSDAQELRPGTVVTVAALRGMCAEVIGLTVQRLSFGSYVGLTDSGREIQFNACHVLRVVWRPR